MSPAAAHPITLETVVFTRCMVNAIPFHVPVEGQLAAAPDNSIDVNKVEGREGAWTASMRCIANKSEDKAFPYRVDIECAAVLHADATLKEDEALRGITITAHSVLYGAIRETVAWLTARQVYGPMVLGLSVLQPNQPVNAENTAPRR